MAETEIDIYLFIVDKDTDFVQDTPENYALMLLPLVQEILIHYPDASFAFDRHFTRYAQQDRVKSVLDNLVHQRLDFEQQDSQKTAGIQVADFVAGATLAKYQREEDKYLELVRERIVIERWSRWGEIKKW